MVTEQLLKEIRSRLAAAYHNRLRGLVLYGAEARGDGQPDSDIDLLVLLDGPIDYGRDLETHLDVLYPLAMRIGRRISAKPVSASEHDTVECPLYQNARREGIVV